MYRKPYHIYMDRLALLPKGYKTIGIFLNFFKEDGNLTMKHIGRFIAKSGKEKLTPQNTVIAILFNNKNVDMMFLSLTKLDTQQSKHGNVFLWHVYIDLSLKL